MHCTWCFWCVQAVGDVYLQRPAGRQYERLYLGFLPALDTSLGFVTLPTLSLAVNDHWALIKGVVYSMVSLGEH
jgi:hypothetical protein